MGAKLVVSFRCSVGGIPCSIWVSSSQNYKNELIETTGVSCVIAISFLSTSQIVWQEKQ